MARGGGLKLFGCAIPLRRERSGGKDIVAAAAAEEATTSGICIAEAAAAVIHIRDGGGGKVRKEGVSANTQVQPSHLLVLPLPEDNDDGEEQEEEEIPTTGGAAIISNNKDNNGSDSNSNKDNHKVMKKPEKLLPCPRCKSLNTKFCYFNNGNANQPRHFCRGCQRYWTAGGALRNVPVGSGRRKSKLSSFSSSSSTSHPLPHHYPPCPVVNRTDGASARSDMADSAQCSLPPQGAVLPTAVIGRRLQMGCSIQDSYKPSKSSSSNGLMAAEDGIEMMMPLDEQSAANGGTTTTTNASNEWNESSNGGGVGETYPPIDEYACGSSEQQPSTIVGGSGGGGYMGNSPPFGFPMQPWPFGYGLFGFSPMLKSNQSSSLTPLAGWCAPPWMGGAGGGVFPWPLMPAIPPWPPWGITPPPMVGAGFTPPCSSSLLALGKHPREGLSQHTASGKDGCPLTPKMLRTQEPQEAAQSSIWSALGSDNNHNHSYNNNNNNSPVSAFGIFKGFPPKMKEKDGADKTQEPHVNPAARTRSMGFHENS